ncbi:DUF1684 domain-containing protein [Terrimonas sp. NA20]|uniref:DUF1684 domain-containing protein n=1 Tax=Terrimonas ginsenosidimutans TaxID=2908004 RepID=A0ABS9KR07_9BACT|nr:DUF1684 domain-containing protein [Terrimonas ginsenosidimutans]MCG2614756.1 DUF1684 domain-containing protein [Terrimonas ginsenosidimutans]
MKTLLAGICLILASVAGAQKPYDDSIRQYVADYVKKHEVVVEQDKKYFRFFPPDEAYRVAAKVKKTPNSKWFTMETSGTVRKTFRQYAILEFSIHDTTVQLPVYQSQGLMTSEEYKNHLFLPFTDLTSGESTYAAGRYIDLSITDVKNDMVTVDFNKAYNPYCAYVTGKYNCPVPPKENQLEVTISAGEQNYAKPHD